MASCKFCGRPVLYPTAFHPSCWEEKVLDIASVFCDEYCRFPRECKDEDELHEQHCDNCALIRALNLGL